VGISGTSKRASTYPAAYLLGTISRQAVFISEFFKELAYSQVQTDTGILLSKTQSKKHNGETGNRPENPKIANPKHIKNTMSLYFRAL